MEYYIENIGVMLTSFALSIVRFLVALSFIPLFEFKQVKARVLKVAISIGVGVPVFFNVQDQLFSQSTEFFFLSFIILKEAAIGLVLGWILAIPFWIFQASGALIDNQRGALSAGYMNPASGPDASMLGDLFGKLVVISLLGAGIFPHLFSFMYLSHKLWPVLDSFPEFQDTAWSELSYLFNYMVSQFVLYAGPVVLILLMVEGAFAFLGAYSPQLQVYFMAMPAKSITALFIVVVYFSNLTENMKAEAFYYLDLNNFFTDFFG